MVIKLMGFHKVLWWCLQVDNMKENSNFKIVKVLKSMSKTILDHLFLSIVFTDNC